MHNLNNVLLVTSQIAKLSKFVVLATYPCLPVLCILFTIQRSTNSVQTEELHYMQKYVSIFSMDTLIYFIFTKALSD